jgi:hypothetical protein
MSRKAPIITLDELKLKMSKYIKSYDDPTYGDDEEFPWNLPSIAIDNDLTKIEFDFENCCIGEDNENGMKISFNVNKFGFQCGDYITCGRVLSGAELTEIQNNFFILGVKYGKLLIKSTTFQEIISMI